VYNNIVDEPGLIILPVTMKTWARAVLSGCYIAFGGLVAVAVVGSSPALVSGAPGLARLVFALVFPVGLLLNLAHGGELFTGNTFWGAAAVMGGKASVSQLAKNWAVAFAGNFVGCIAILSLVLASGLFPTGSPAAAFAQSLSDAKMALPLGQVFCRAVLANWLVCLAVWQASTARTASDRFFAVWPPISAFVAAGLEHSVANMFLIPLGLAVGGAEGLSAASLARFLAANLAPVTLGNAVAGAVVVAGASHLAYGSSRKGV
jgi:formate/nitrite transporter